MLKPIRSILPLFVSLSICAQEDFQPRVKPQASIIPKSIALHKCISIGGPIPNWNGKRHPEGTIQWFILGSQRGRDLYCARYTWPSEELEGTKYLVVTEVIYEGSRKSGDLRPLYAFREDQTYNYLYQPSLHWVGRVAIAEVETCLNGTGGCLQEFFIWTPGNFQPIKEKIRQSINTWLPTGYTTFKAPLIDIDSLSGESGAWQEKQDGNCCPSRSVKFSIELVGAELRVKSISFVPIDQSQ